jgi:hypothetical protein
MQVSVPRYSDPMLLVGRLVRVNSSYQHEAWRIMRPRAPLSAEDSDSKPVAGQHLIDFILNKITCVSAVAHLVVSYIGIIK